MLKKLSVAIISGLFILFLWNSQSFAQSFDDDNFGPPKGEMGQNHRGMGGQGDQMKRGHRGGHDGMRNFMKELNLTEEQKETLKAKREAAKGEIDSIRNQIKPEMEKMMDLMHSPDATKQQIYAQIDKVGNLKIEMHKIRAGNLIELKEILNPEQKAKLQELTAKKKDKMKQMMQNRQGQRFKQRKNNSNN